MLKKSYLSLPFFLLLLGCQQKSNIFIENTLYEKNTNYAVENKKPEFKYKPIITPEEYKKLIQANGNNQENITKNNSADINTHLMSFYKEWKGTKYRFGGNSKKGIDCSAFTQRIYKEKFNIKIPRSTRTQVKVGKEIKRSELKLGDLIFFKTGKIDRHVGVYMGNGDFMHASIKGVKFSKVDKPFYKKAYWTSRRIIN